MKPLTAFATALLLAACSSARITKNTIIADTVAAPDTPPAAAPAPLADSSHHKAPTWNSSPRVGLNLAALPLPAPTPAPAALPSLPALPAGNAAALKRLDSVVTHLQQQVHKDSVRFLALAAAAAERKRPDRGQHPPQAAPSQQAAPQAPSLAEAARLVREQSAPAPTSAPVQSGWNLEIIFSGAMLGLALIFFTFYFTKKHYAGVPQNLQRTGNRHVV